MPGFLVIDPYVEWIRSLMPDPADQTWLFAKLVPQPLATYTQPIRLGNPAAAAIPRSFVFCTEGKGDAAADSTVRNANGVRSAPGWHYRAGEHPPGAGQHPAGDGRDALVPGVGAPMRGAERAITARILGLSAPVNHDRKVGVSLFASM